MEDIENFEEDYATFDEILQDAEYRAEFDKKVKEQIEIERHKWEQEKEEDIGIKKLKNVMNIE